MKQSTPLKNWKEIGCIKIQPNSEASQFISTIKSDKFVVERKNILTKDKSHSIFKRSQKSKEKDFQLKKNSRISEIHKKNPEDDTFVFQQDQRPMIFKDQKQSPRINEVKRCVTEEISQKDNLQINNSISKNEQLNKIRQIQDQFLRFKEDVMMQVKKMEQKMNEIISEVIINFNRQMNKVRFSQSEVEKQLKKQIQITVAPLKKSLNNLSNASVILQRKTPQKRLQYRDLTESVKSGKICALNSGKKEEFKKFTEAIKRLKTDIEEERFSGEMSINQSHLSYHRGII